MIHFQMKKCNRDLTGLFWIVALSSFMTLYSIQFSLAADIDLEMNKTVDKLYIDLIIMYLNRTKWKTFEKNDEGMKPPERIKEDMRKNGIRLIFFQEGGISLVKKKFTVIKDDNSVYGEKRLVSGVIAGTGSFVFSNRKLEDAFDLNSKQKEVVDLPFTAMAYIDSDGRLQIVRIGLGQEAGGWRSFALEVLKSVNFEETAEVRQP